ncbi:lipopolysaccharide biosynthesis protein [Stenotrophomonas terrae]|nr:hypothetical protein [Stenotrophomonas terrae]
MNTPHTRGHRQLSGEDQQRPDSKHGSLRLAMLKLAGGNAVGKLAALIAIPVIARLYKPEHLGMLAAFSALVALAATLSTLRYVCAIPLPRRDSTALVVTCLALIVLSIYTPVATATAYVVGPALLTYTSLSALIPYLPLIIAGTALTACHEILTLWATRKQQFGQLAVSQAQQGLVGSVAKTLLGALQFKPLGLLLGHLLQLAGGNGPLIKSFATIANKNLRYVRRSRMRLVAAHFSEMPRYQLPSQFLTMATIHAPALLAPRVFGLSGAGQLALALTALSLPINLLANSMGNVYLAKISIIGRKQPSQIMAITGEVTRTLVALVFLPTLILLLAGPWLFEFIFGSTWRLAGEIAQILSVSMAFQFVSAPVAHALSVLRAQQLLLQLNASRFLIVTGVFASASLFGWSIKHVTVLYSALLCLHYMLSYGCMMQLIRKHARAHNNDSCN